MIKIFAIISMCLVSLLALFVMPGCNNITNSKDKEVHTVENNYIQVTTPKEVVMFEFKKSENGQVPESYAALDFMKYIMENGTARPSNVSTDFEIYNYNEFSSGYYGNVYTLNLKEHNIILSDDFYFMGSVADNSIPVYCTEYVCSGVPCQCPGHQSLYLGCSITEDEISLYVYGEGGVNCFVDTNLKTKSGSNIYDSFIPCRGSVRKIINDTTFEPVLKV